MNQAKILYKSVIEYENASNNHILKNASFEKDHTGQVVVYTGIFLWKSDGTYRDGPEEKSDE